MIAPAECQGCGHLCSGTSGGHRHDACTNNNNRSKFTSAPICRAMGWHETPADLRARAARDAIQKRNLLLQQIGFESPRRGECRALMLFPQPSSLVLKITRAIETAVLRKNGIKVAE